MAKRVPLVLLISSISILGYGQEYRSFRAEREEVVRTAEYRIGPFLLFPSFGVRDIGYDSNVYYEREDQGPVSDYTFTISPSVRFYYLFRNRIIVSVYENPEYVYYFEEKRERGWNNTFTPEIRVLLLNHIVLNGSYLNSKMRYRATAEFNSRVNEYRKGYRASLFYETPRGTSLGISGQAGEVTYGDVQDLSIASSLNRREEEANLEFYYRVFAESFFFFKGGYKEYNFMDTGTRWRDAHSYQAISGIQFPILGRMTGALTLGYKNLVPRDGSKKSFSGFVGDTSLSLKISRFNFRFGFLRDSSFSYWADNIFFIDNQVGAGVSFYLTKFLRVDYDFRYGEYSYPEESFIVTPDGQQEGIKRTDLYRSHVAGFVVRIIRNTGLGLMVNSWERESNIAFENRKRLFWGAYLTYEF